MSVVFGVSRARTYWRRPFRVWGWYGWIAWPLSSGGAHYSGHRFPLRCLALLQARRMARAAGGGQRADVEQSRRRDAGGSDPLRWGRPIYWKGKS